MLFVTESVSRIAGRELNEDSCGSLELGNAGCWVVADGLGGHRGGEAAATIAVDAVLASFRAAPEFSKAALERHLEAAQEAILKVQRTQPTLSSMRTTIVVLISDSRQALWAHVGDSRLYCLEAGRIVFCTSDHSVVQARVAAGELSADQIRNNEDRNRLLRTLGNRDGDLRPSILAEPRRLYRGTAFLLCTDGFWENVIEAEMEIDLAKADGPGHWLAAMEARLLERLKDDSDNYTAMALFFESQTAPVPPAVPDVRSNGARPKRGGSWVAMIFLGLLSIGLAVSTVRMRNERERVAQEVQERKNEVESLKQEIGGLKQQAQDLRAELDKLKNKKDDKGKKDKEKETGK